MLTLAIRNIQRSKWRSFLLIFGILVTIALETGIVVTVDTIFEDFLYDNRNQNYTDITVNPKSWIELEDLREITKTIGSLSGVSKASEVYYLSTDLIKNQSGDWINPLIYGINHHTHPDYNSLNLIDGSLSLGGTSILISQAIQDAIGVSINGELVIQEQNDIGFTGITLRVAGIFSTPPFFGNREDPLVILMDIETLLESFQVSESADALRSKIDIRTSNLLKIDKVADRIRDTIGPEYSVYVEKYISEFQSLGISAYTAAMNLIILASLLMEFLFLTNILTMAIRERQKEHGILRTVGISSKQLFLVIINEILIYSIIGVLFGIIVGIGFANLLVDTLDQYYSSFEFRDILIKSSSIFVIALSGLIIALLSGIYPIYIALKVPVIRNIHYRMRSSDDSLIRNYWKYTLIFGAILAISGFIFSLFTSPAGFLEFSIFSNHFLVIIYIFIGTLLIEAGLLVLLPRIGEKFLIIFNKVPRQISMRNIRREFHKSLFTVISFSVAIAFIILVGIVSNVVIISVPEFYEDQWGSIDLVAETNDANSLPLNFTEELVSNERIKRASYIQESRITIDSVSTNVYGVDPMQYSEFREITYEKISSELSHQLLSKNSSYGTNALVSDILYNSLDVSLGENILLKFPSLPSVNITIAAVIKGNSFLGNGRYLYLASTHFQRFFNTTRAKIFICDVYEGLDIHEAQRNISRSYPIFNEVFGVDYYRDVIERSLKFQANLFQVLVMESFILAGLAQFVSILISTINTEREMGIIRSMGLTRWGVFSIYFAESTTLGICSLVIGLVDGVLGAVLLLWYLSSSIPIQMVLPLDHILTWIIFAFILTLISTIVPALRSSKNDIAATISARPIKLIPDKKGKLQKATSFLRKIGNLFYYALLIVVAYFILVFSILIIGYIIVFILWFFNDVF